MSYILDALKRSEQERQQENGVNVSAELLILDKKTQKDKSLPVFLIVLVVVNLSVLVYLFAFNQSDDSVSAQRQSGSVKNERSADGFENITSNKAPYAQPNRIESISAENPRTKAIPDFVVKDIQAKKQFLSTDASSNLNNAPTAKYDSPSASRLNNARAPSYFQVDKQAQGVDVLSQRDSDMNVVQNQNDKNESVYSYGSELSESAGFEGELIRPKGYQEKKEGSVSAVEVTSENISSSNIIRPKAYVASNESVNVVSSPKSAVKPFDLTHIPHLTDLNLSFQKSIPDITFNSHIFSEDPNASRVMINNLYLRRNESFSGVNIVYIGEYYLLLEKSGTQFKIPVLRDWQRP